MSHKITNEDDKKLINAIKENDITSFLIVAVHRDGHSSLYMDGDYEKIAITVSDAMLDNELMRGFFMAICDFVREERIKQDTNIN